MKKIIGLLLALTACSVSAGNMERAGLGVYVYDYLVTRCAKTWGETPEAFVAKHMANLEEHNVDFVHLTVNDLDQFKNLWLPLLEKHDIKALVQLDFAYFRNSGDWKNPEYMDSMAKKAADFINQYKDRPNILAFSIREEAGEGQMKLISDYYNNIFKYAPGTKTFVCHNMLNSAKAHLEPYPEIFGTDRYTFGWNGSAGGYLQTPSYSLNWIRSQAKDFYKEAAARNADFLMVLHQGGTRHWYRKPEEVIKDKKEYERLMQYGKEGSMGFQLHPGGQLSYWAYYKMPPNFLRASVWVSILEGAKYVAFYNYMPIEKEKLDYEKAIADSTAHSYRKYNGQERYSLAPIPGQENRLLEEFAQTSKEVAPYGKLMMKMNKVTDPETVPVIKVVAPSSTFANDFKVPGIQGTVTILFNSNAGSWPEGSAHFLKPHQRLYFDEAGEMVGYKPRTGVDKVDFTAGVGPEDSVWHIGNGTKLNNTAEIEPGSGVLLFTGTQAEFAKVNELLK